MGFCILTGYSSSGRGGSTVNWYEIQPKLVEDPKVKSDVLILLDCCHAAQAGRGRDSAPEQKRCELLAACAMGVGTPEPGEYSFTMRMIQEIGRMLAESKEAIITHLHGRLTKKGVLQQTPVHVDLLGKSPKRGIRLQPVHKDEQKPSRPVEYSQDYLKLKISVDSLVDGHLTIQQWLKAEPPRCITGVEIEDISYAKNLMAVVMDSANSPDCKPTYENFSPAGKEDIKESWNSIKTLLTSSPVCSASFGMLRTFYSTLQSSIRRNLLNLPRFNDAQEVGNLAQNDIVKAAGLSESLLVRQEVIKLGQEPPPPDNLKVALSRIQLVDGSLASNQRLTRSLIDPDQTTIILEYKDYVKDDRVRHDSRYTERVRKLARLLSMPTAANFHNLQCRHWYEEPAKCRFGFVFDVPPEYRESRAIPDRLLNIMKTKNKLSRPTLGERFKLAYELGLAVESWHAVGWVHQSISSHNIFIFPVKAGTPNSQNPSAAAAAAAATVTRWDYPSPFLGGFEYARPYNEPSVSITVDDFDDNVYRHPARQGIPGERFSKEHDLYSFGVLLLEIGLWQPASAAFDPRRRTELTPNALRSTLFKSAEERLPHYMGTAYAKAVCDCLDGSFGVDTDDKLQTRLGKAFREKVVNVMSEGLNLG